jgi:hypothetical protein
MQPVFYCNHAPESVMVATSSRIGVVEISEPTTYTISLVGIANRLTLKTNPQDPPFPCDKTFKTRHYLQEYGNDEPEQNSRETAAPEHLQSTSERSLEDHIAMLCRPPSLGGI